MEEQSTIFDKIFTIEHNQQLDIISKMTIKSVKDVAQLTLTEIENIVAILEPMSRLRSNHTYRFINRVKTIEGFRIDTDYV